MTSVVTSATERDRVRIALVGLDHWYTSLPLVDALSSAGGDARRAEVVVVWDRDAARAREVASKARADVATDWQAAVSRPDVDAVASFVTVRDNPAVVLAAARAGKHIMCVKPVAMSLADVDVMAAVVAQAGVAFFPIEGYYRLTPHCAELRRLVQDRAAGGILTISVTGRAGVPQAWPGDDGPGWYADPAEVPGGAWIDHGIYQVALARWLLGSEPRSVCGSAANRTARPMANEDYGLALFEFTDGTLVSLEETWTLPRGMYHYRMDIVGTEGMISYSNQDGKIWLARPGQAPAWIEHDVRRPAGGPLPDYLQHFIDCVRGRSAPVSTVEDASADLAACLAFYEAARRVARVSIP